MLGIPLHKLTNCVLLVLIRSCLVLFVGHFPIFLLIPEWSCNPTGLISSYRALTGTLTKRHKWYIRLIPLSPWLRVMMWLSWPVVGHMSVAPEQKGPLRCHQEEVLR